MISSLNSFHRNETPCPAYFLSFGGSFDLSHLNLMVLNVKFTLKTANLKQTFISICSFLVETRFVKNERPSEIRVLLILIEIWNESSFNENWSLSFCLLGFGSHWELLGSASVPREELKGVHPAWMLLNQGEGGPGALCSTRRLAG